MVRAGSVAVEAELERQEGRLTLNFTEARLARAFVERAVEERGFLTPLEEKLAFMERLDVRVLSPDGIDFSFPAEVGKIFDTVSGGYGIAFLLDEWDERKKAEYRLKVGVPAAARAERSPPPERHPQEEAADLEARGETRGRSAIHRIREMNPNQKMRLAMRADRTERQILLRDSSPQVLQGLLVNPRLESKDVLRLVKSTHVTAPILQRVVEDGRWGKNQEILATVAKNPRTPTPSAVRLMDRLRTSDLRMMGKINSGLRENIRKAALREYLRRGGRS